VKELELVMIESDYKGKITNLLDLVYNLREKREKKCVVDLEMEQRESSKREALMEINLHYIIEKEKTQKSENLAMINRNHNEK
jgi:hypothetical protein